MANRVISTALAAIVVALSGVFFSPVSAPASAQTSAQRQVGNMAEVRGAHFSPDTPGVDVYLSSYSGTTTTLWLSNIGYGDVSGYRRVKPGLYIVSMRKHGASPSSPAGLKWTLDAKPGNAYTAAAVGMNKHLTGIVLKDQLTPPRAGHALVRVIQAASRAPHATLVAQPHTVVASDAAFASTTKYASVPAGRWTIRAAAVPDSVSTSKTITVQSGSIESLVVLDSKGTGISLRAIEDASGATTSPQGSINAGGGGTAEPAARPANAAWVVLLASAAVLFGAGSLVVIRRRSGIANG